MPGLQSNTFKEQGFTLIEVIFVIALITFIASFGTIAGLDMYQRYNFNSQSDIAISLLQKARSEAMNNISGQPHGVYFADPDNLILFTGSSFGSAYELKLGKNKAVQYAGASSIVFSQLSATTTAASVTITQDAKIRTISVNAEGGIDY